MTNQAGLNLLVLVTDYCKEHVFVNRAHIVFHSQKRRFNWQVTWDACAVRAFAGPAS